MPLSPTLGRAVSPVTGFYQAAGGPRLAAFLDSLPLRTRWLQGHPVCWQSGQQNGPAGSLPAEHTHCGAFAAAVALYLDIYLLRPPHHEQRHLVEAQAAWLGGSKAFGGPTAAAAGWLPLGRSSVADAVARAVRAANAGQLVLACTVPGPVRHPAWPGPASTVHVAIVRPAADPADATVPAEGPDVIMAGERNYTFVSMQAAFAGSSGAWPDRIALYSHDTALQHDVGG